MKIEDQQRIALLSRLVPGQTFHKFNIEVETEEIKQKTYPKTGTPAERRALRAATGDYDSRRDTGSYEDGERRYYWKEHGQMLIDSGRALKMFPDREDEYKISILEQYWNPGNSNSTRIIQFGNTSTGYVTYEISNNTSKVSKLLEKLRETGQFSQKELVEAAESPYALKTLYNTSTPERQSTIRTVLDTLSQDKRGGVKSIFYISPEKNLIDRQTEIENKSALADLIIAQAAIGGEARIERIKEILSDGEIHDIFGGASTDYIRAAIVNASSFDPEQKQQYLETAKKRMKSRFGDAVTEKWMQKTDTKILTADEKQTEANNAAVDKYYQGFFGVGSTP